MLLCHSIMGYSQDWSASLTGTVIDFHDKSPLAGATITVLGQNKAVLSNLDGNYEFKGLCTGNYELEVSHPECTTLFIPIEISGAQELDIKLEHHLEALKEQKSFP